MFRQGDIDRVRAIVYGMLGLGVFFNIGAYLITVYMLTNFSHLIRETNPIPAYVFANFGFAPMLVVTLLIWIMVFVTLRFWGKRHGRKQQLALAIFFMVLLVPMTFMDFANNFHYLSVYLLPTIIT